jgi:hypothetical protein
VVVVGVVVGWEQQRPKNQESRRDFPDGIWSSILFPCQGEDRSFGRRAVRKPLPCIRTRMAWVAFTVGTAEHGCQFDAPDEAGRASRAAARLLTLYAWSVIGLSFWSGS